MWLGGPLKTNHHQHQNLNNSVDILQSYSIETKQLLFHTIMSTQMDGFDWLTHIMVSQSDISDAYRKIPLGIERETAKTFELNPNRNTGSGALVG